MKRYHPCSEKGFLARFEIISVTTQVALFRSDARTTDGKRMDSLKLREGSPLRLAIEQTRSGRPISVGCGADGSRL